VARIDEVIPERNRLAIPVLVMGTPMVGVPNSAPPNPSELLVPIPTSSSF
jgi:hypothetical protein